MTGSNPVQVLKCPCCGAKVKPGIVDCDFCGSHLQVMAAEKHIQCSNCQADLIDGISFCPKCGVLQFMSAHLRDRATKVQFSQDKYREQFFPEIRQHFADDEFIYAETFGPFDYYILSDRRLYIAEVIGSGVFLRDGLKQIVELQRVTKRTCFSDPFFAESDYTERNPLVSLQIETFDGDINLTVNWLEENDGLYEDPGFFESQLNMVLSNIQEGKISQKEALWRAPRLAPFVKAPSPEKPVPTAQTKPASPPTQGDPQRLASHAFNRSIPQIWRSCSLFGRLMMIGTYIAVYFIVIRPIAHALRAWLFGH